MITYVDTSMLLKLVVDEDGSDRAELIWDTADALAAVNLIVLEARAALASARRAGRLTPGQHTTAKAHLGSLIGGLHLAEVTDRIIDSAALLTEDEGLRGYDAVHLAAALDLGASVLSSADKALCAAAGRRALHVADPLAD